MKRDSILIGVLLTTALIMSVAFLTSGNRQATRADILTTGGDYTMLTWGSGGMNANLLTVYDQRHKLMLSYILDGRILKLQSYVSLRRRFHPQPLR
ncbi:MAG: hypothetical protein HKL95_11170 [Phycisphaerae bacterium]|nr:hypothetical protein [Phycisphaerae bacterium]